MPFTMTNVQNLPHRIEFARQRLLAALCVLNGISRTPAQSVSQTRTVLAEASDNLQNLSNDLEMVQLELAESSARLGDRGTACPAREPPELPFTD